MYSLTILSCLLAYMALHGAYVAGGQSCSDSTPDIYILGDASNSIAPIGYSRELNFIANFVRNATLKNFHFAFGAFSTPFKHHINLNTYSNADDFSAAVLKIAQLKSNTDTAGAIKAVRLGDFLFDESKGARPGVPKVMIIITDGQSDNPQATQVEAAQLRGLGVRIIAVGVGVVDKPELVGVCGGDETSVFTVKGFGDINSILTQLSEKVCVTDAPTPPPCVPKSPISIGFAIDSSGSIGLDNFQFNIKAVIKAVNGVIKALFSALTFGTHVRFVSGYTSDKDVFIARVKTAQYQNSTTSTDLAIDALSAQSESLPAGTTKLFFIITDGKSTNPAATQVAAKNARDKGASLYVLAVGKDYDRPEVEGITNDPDKVFYANDYEDLVNHINELIKAACEATPPPTTTTTTTTTPEPTTTTTTTTPEPTTTTTTTTPEPTTTTTTTTPEPTTTTTTTTTTVKPCPPAKPADIYFCIDGSGSIGVGSFGSNKVLVNNVISAYDVSPDGTYIGVATYGTHSYSVTPLSGDKDKITQDVNNMGYRNSSTGTDLCIDAARKVLQNGRPGAVKILIVVTDGKSNNEALTAASAAAIQGDGVIVIALGVGSSIYEPELQKIASDHSKVFHAASYERLWEVTGSITQSTCDQIKSDA